jgi:hypothetical protein
LSMHRHFVGELMRRQVKSASRSTSEKNAL